MDGPVVLAAMRALAAKDLAAILPYVKVDAEAELGAAFARAIGVRSGGGPAQELADLYFAETAVRLHRAGEKAPYTGLKPAGLGFGPVVPVAERAFETGSADELVEVLTRKVSGEVRERFEHAIALQAKSDGSAGAARAAVEAMLGLEVWSHKLYGCASAGPHEEHGETHEHAE